MTHPVLPPVCSRWRRSLAALCVSAAAGFAAGPAPAQPLNNLPNSARLPTLGDTAREDLSPVVERKLGEEIMREIRRDRDYLDDDAISEYLNNFGGGLVDAVPGARGETNADFTFFPLRDANINAFALPGGFIGIHSGLLLAAQTESELASVVSHEIGHVSQRHIARMLGAQRQDALLPLAAFILAALAARASPDAAMGVLMGGQGLAVQRQLNFSRDAEREADRVGFQIMSAGGYDTSGMVAFFRRLQSATKVYGEIPAFLSSHPLTSDRIVDIQARIRETPYRQRPDAIEFHHRQGARPGAAGYEHDRAPRHAHRFPDATGPAAPPAAGGGAVRLVLPGAERERPGRRAQLVRQGACNDQAEGGRPSRPRRPATAVPCSPCSTWKSSSRPDNRRRSPSKP
jgi:predicted Zn-dependent protease